MMNLIFGLFTQVRDSGPQGPLVSYFPLIVSGAISCPLHNLKTLWYIIMIVHSYVEYVLKICHVKE